MWLVTNHKIVFSWASYPRSRKVPNMTATSSFQIANGVDNAVTKPISAYASGHDILADGDLLSFLGVSTENVELTRNGVAVSADEHVQAGDTWSFRTKANVKG